MTTTTTPAVAPSRGMAVIQKELQEIAISHKWPCPKRKNNNLQPRHLPEFEFRLDSVDSEEGEDDPDASSYFSNLFIRFARVVCKADCVVRKELFETWAMALHVHDHFPDARRFADMASGHGLLSWALLLLNQNRTAICVDCRMPKSAEKLRNEFVKEWPDLEGRWDFVEGKLEYVEPAPSTLIVGVHCCGILSDRVVDLAIKGRSPLALVPCCHTSKHMSEEEKMDWKNSTWTLADLLDRDRVRRLKDANFDVVEGEIPKVFTPKNRIILAATSAADIEEEEKADIEDSEEPTRGGANEAAPGAPPPSQTVVDNMSICRIPFGMPEFAIPIADIESSKASIRNISGRAAANLRKGHPRSLGLSLFQTAGSPVLTPDQVAAVANALDENIVAWGCYVDDEAFLNKDGRLCRTYRLTYRSRGEEALTKPEAKAIHIQMCRKLPEVYPGVQVRQIPR